MIPEKYFKLNPYLAILIAATLGGCSAIFVKLINMSATSLTFFRTFVPVIILLVYFSFIGWKNINIMKGNYKIMLLASLFNAVRMFLYFFALIYTSVANAIIILFTWPIFASIFGIIFFKEKVSKKEFGLILLAFTGIIIMYLDKNIAFGSKDFIGMGAMLLSAISFAITVVIFKKELKYYSKTETIFYQNLIGALVFIPFFIYNTINEPITMIQTSSAILYGLVVGIGVFLLFFYALKKLSVSHYSLFSYWEVIAAVIFGLIFLKETITINIIVGGSLIIVSGFLLTKEKE